MTFLRNEDQQNSSTAFSKLARDYLVVLLISIFVYVFSPNWGPTLMKVNVHGGCFAFAITILTTYWLLCGFLVGTDRSENLASNIPAWIGYAAMWALLPSPLIYMETYRGFDSSHLFAFCRIAGISVEPGRGFDLPSACYATFEYVISVLLVAIMAGFAMSVVAKLLSSRFPKVASE